MKKALSFVLALALVLSLCLAGFSEDLDNTTTSKTTTETTSESTTSESTTSESTTSESTTSESTTTGTTTENTTVTAPPPIEIPPAELPTSALPQITKSPTSETVREGGFAEFVARADNCLGIIWHLQSPGGGRDILVKDADEHFPSLIINGLETDRLSLNGIPRDLNEWRVRAEFVGPGGNVWSDSAIITVINQELATPTIQSHPQNAELNQGETTSLQVSAQLSGQGNSLTYQWYRNTVNSNVGGKAILGATSPSYTPEYDPGTVYYYCAVRASDGTDISPPAKTACAAVSYPAATETTAQLSTLPASEISAATLTTWGTVAHAEEHASVTQTETTVPVTAPARLEVRFRNPLLLMVAAVLLAVGVAGILAVVLIHRFHSDQEEKKAAAARYNRKEPAAGRQPFVRQEDPDWDDLSDLDLSAYFDDEDEDL